MDSLDAILELEISTSGNGCQNLVLIGFEGCFSGHLKANLEAAELVVSEMTGEALRREPSVSICRMTDAR